MRIRTTLVPGDFDSFKAALGRSILGVTFKKFRKRGSAFFQTRAYNSAIVAEFCRQLHEKLQGNFDNIPLKYLQIKADMNVTWNDIGRIIAISDVELSAYVLLGQLSVTDAVIQSQTDRVKVDFFYSPIDLGSQVVKKTLDDIESEMGKLLERHDYDFMKSDDSIKKIAKALNVSRVPTVVLNQSDLLENPSRSELLNKVNEALHPSVHMGNVNFSLEPSLLVLSESLVSLSKSH